MSDVLTFYLDGTIVQVLRVGISDHTVSVRNALTFPYAELDNYLSGCREKSCILCCSPSIFNQDIVYLPPATEKFYNTLVHAEVNKKHGGPSAFTLFYRILGEATMDGILYNKISVFSYMDDFLSDFISIFNRHGMTVSHLYDAPYSIFRLAAAAIIDDPGKTRIFIAPVPGEKLILLSENNELGFIRKIPSSELELLSTDIQSIDMTVDYCFQTLRVKPVEAVILHSMALPPDTPPKLDLPFRYLTPSPISDVSPDIARDYLAPLAAAVHNSESPGACDILPPLYVSFKKSKKILTTSIIVLIVLSVVLAGLSVFEKLALSDIESGIGVLRSHLGRTEADVSEYKKLDEETKLHNHLIGLLNRLTALTPETALPPLALPGTTDYLFNRITLKKGDGFVTVTLTGTISGKSLKESQTIFENLVELMRKIPGYSLTSSSVDVKKNTFSMEARYSGSGQQGK